MAAAVTCLMIERMMCGLMVGLMWVGKDRVLVVWSVAWGICEADDA